MKKTAFIGLIAATLLAGSISSPAQAAEEYDDNAGIFTAQIPVDGGSRTEISLQPRPSLTGFGPMLQTRAARELSLP